MTFRRASWPPELHVGDRVVIRVVRGEPDYFGTIVDFASRACPAFPNDPTMVAVVEVDADSYMPEHVKAEPRHRNKYYQGFLTKIDP